MPRSVELKLRLPDMTEYHRVYSAAARLSTEPIKLLTQSDMYFSVRRPDAVRMKLRTQYEGCEMTASELIVYSRPDGTDTRPSSYVRLDVPRADRVLLESALGPCEVVVSKTRTLFLVDHVRIHLDFVQQAGRFLKFEAVLGDDADEQRDGHACIGRLCTALGVSDAERESRGYREIILGL